MDRYQRCPECDRLFYKERIRALIETIEKMKLEIRNRQEQNSSNPFCPLL